MLYNKEIDSLLDVHLVYSFKFPWYQESLRETGMSTGTPRQEGSIIKIKENAQNGINY